MNERALLFGAAGTLSGVTTDPRGGDWNRRPAAVFLNAGLVHRAGPNRLYVRLARRLAERGIGSLRFDFSGLGDSAPRADRLAWEQSSVDEARPAVDLLAHRYGCERFVLIGLCSGALAALRTIAQEERVVGAALVNTRGGSEQLRSYIRAQASTRKLSRLALSDPRTWFSAVRRKSTPRHVRELVTAMTRGYVQRRRRRELLRRESAAIGDDWRRAVESGAKLLLVYSQWDPGLTFLRMTLGEDLDRFREQGRLDLNVISAADHTFTPPAARERLLTLIDQWSENFEPAKLDPPTGEDSLPPFQHSCTSGTAAADPLLSSLNS